MTEADKIRLCMDAFKEISAQLTQLAVLDPMDESEALVYYENAYTAIANVTAITLNKIGAVLTPHPNKGVH